jgi:hypothetical protein
LALCPQEVTIEVFVYTVALNDLEQDLYHGFEELGYIEGFVCQYCLEDPKN